MRSDDSSSVVMRPFHLLLIEDNPGDARLVSEVFHSSRRTVIRHVESTNTACDFLNQKAGFEQSCQPDLILLDLGLPVLSGQVFLRVRQRIPEWMAIPVVVYTSSARDADRQICLFLGADDYLVKPTVWADWVLVLRTLVDIYAVRRW